MISVVTLSDVVCLIKTPLMIRATIKRQDYVALLRTDGTIAIRGHEEAVFDDPGQAEAACRNLSEGKPLLTQPFQPAGGWYAWWYVDPETGNIWTLNRLRSLRRSQLEKSSRRRQAAYPDLWNRFALWGPWEWQG